MIVTYRVREALGFDPEPIQPWPRSPSRLTAYYVDDFGEPKIVGTVRESGGAVTFEPFHLRTDDLFHIAMDPADPRNDVTPSDGPRYMAGLVVTLGRSSRLRIAVEYP